MVDQQLPPALAYWLNNADHVAEHVAWKGMDRAPDDAIWREAIRLGAVIVSKDDDFARRRMAASDGPPVVWIRVGNARTSALLQTFTDAMSNILDAISSGEVLIELL